MSQVEILTIPDVAKLLRVAEKTLYGLAQQRLIPGFKVGGQWRFSRAAIDEWIKARTHSGEQNPATNGRRETAPASRRPRKGR